MRVLIVPDKFKGTLRAEQAADAIARGWRAVRPNDTLELLPMSDGGDGFGEILGSLLHAQRRTYQTVNAAHEPVEAAWWWSENSGTAVVESANVIGLAMLQHGTFHPFELDTLGLGQLLLHISREHPGFRIIIGIGGSATNDGGFGLARGMGYRFLDLHEFCLARWTAMDTLLHLQQPETPATFREVTIACDVQNRLLGAEGASRIYGPQKGLRPEDFPHAEKCLSRLTEVVRADLGMDCAEEPGTGAAGGLGYGLRVFLNGTFEPGFDIFARIAQLDEKIARADLVITAEGSIDAQTEMGKGTGAIAKRARDQNKRCIGLAGWLPQKENSAFDLALGIAPELTTVEEAKASPAEWLAKLASLAATQISMMAIFLILMSGCASAPRDAEPSSGEARAIQFLAAEVPAWKRDNGCYSCHNNGDGARALVLAQERGWLLPDGALQDTLAWLRAPDLWDKNKGDPEFSDQQLADIQFAAALLADNPKNAAILKKAAKRLVQHQASDGAWHVEPENPVGSPVTYGSTLATYTAWRVLSAVEDSSVKASRRTAEAWLDRAGAKNIPAAAALLMYSQTRQDDARSRKLLTYLKQHQLNDGGWGPYPLAPSEVFDTALVLLAITPFTRDSADDAKAAARAHLLSRQNSDGSWPATTRPTGGQSYAQQISTTAWATIALLNSNSGGKRGL